MGIKHLNRFFKENAGESMKFISIADLSGKRIAVDISIYMYKYASDDVLIENIYLLLSIFRHYNVIPIFVFDGKPPTEKKELLKKRRQDKKEAEAEYNQLKNKLSNNDGMDDIEKQDIINNMDMLKRRFVNINKNDIENVKELIRSYGATYYDAPGEADRLCAYLLKNGKAWGCISDDMDMFLYGCSFVMRNLSLMNHTILLYDTNIILSELEMTEKQFCEIMVLSGTDYNINSNTSLKETINWYYEYMKYLSNINNPYGFYVWLLKNTKYVTDYKKLLSVYKIFQFHNSTELENWKNIEFIEKPLDQIMLKEIMEKEGFVFAN
jgi:flap endonuclease-1